MANAGVTTTGLREMRAGVEKLPAAVTAQLRSVAWRTSRRVMAGAKARLLARTHGTGRTADAIKVIEEADRKQFVVASQGRPDRPANLPLWLELGTVHMQGIHYMRDALLAESAQYVREGEAASIAAAREALG